VKATGIVRRIDELGRVVIPKEIRRTLRIREGDPLEIFTDREGGVILKKYSPIGELLDFAREFTDAIHKTLGHIAVICDKDLVLAVGGPGKKEYIDMPVTGDLEELMENRKSMLLNTIEGKEAIPIIRGEDISKVSSQAVAPVISEGQAIGAVVLVSKEDRKMGDTELKVAETVAGFLGRQMEQ